MERHGLDEAVHARIQDLCAKGDALVMQLHYHYAERAEDLFAYRDRRRAESERAFQELADLSQDHDLGY